MVELNKILGVDSSPEDITRVHVDDPQATEALTKDLWGFLHRRLDPYQKPLLILCIGTDRSTGDCLGPLVGAKLCSLGTLPPAVRVLGTLEEPIHAANLDACLHMLRRENNFAYILALDACLGKSENIGYITVKDGPLKPGTGVNKNLAEVGACHMIGVVNVGGFMEYFVLQNTRLSLVVRMADVMANALAGVLSLYWESFYPHLSRDWGSNLPASTISTGGWAANHAAPSRAD